MATAARVVAAVHTAEAETEAATMAAKEAMTGVADMAEQTGDTLEEVVRAMEVVAVAVVTVVVSLAVASPEEASLVETKVAMRVAVVRAVAMAAAMVVVVRAVVMAAAMVAVVRKEGLEATEVMQEAMVVMEVLAAMVVRKVAAVGLVVATALMKAMQRAPKGLLAAAPRWQAGAPACF